MKLKLRRRLVKAYANNDRAVLKQIATKDAQELYTACVDYRHSFSTAWYRTSKPFGVELMEGRIATLAERCLVLSERLVAYLKGEIDSIPELAPHPELRGHGKPPELYAIERIRQSSIL